MFVLSNRQEEISFAIADRNMKIKSIDDYIALQPMEKREMLEQLREVIKSVVPNAEELISYQIPSFKLYGMLVGFGVHKAGCSFYAFNPRVLASYKEELKDYKYSGGTIHIGLDQKIPTPLIKKIVKYRVKENEERRDKRQYVKPKNKK
ncbi:MAG: DUF1801 domain-containing protein [Cyclobacteriaceae bacterium]